MDKNNKGLYLLGLQTSQEYVALDHLTIMVLFVPMFSKIIYTLV